MTTRKLKTPAPEEPFEGNSPETVSESASVSESEMTEEPIPDLAVTQETTPETIDKEEVAVDFSDEEVELAANAPEFDLGESESTENDEEIPLTNDYSGKTREEIITDFRQLLEAKPIQSIRHEVEALKIAFYKSYRGEVEELRKIFMEAGGNPDEFVKPTDEQELTFKEVFGIYRQKRDLFIAGLEGEKESNYKAKLQIIEELKELVNSSETLNHTFNAFRELQQRWKETGGVPQNHIKDLWETYHLHVENFYNFIKINKELRDLDLKKNYEAKVKLCEEAEQLSLEGSIVEAFHKLQKLHEEWRETGPVANESKEQLWDRFREASATINKRHQEHFDQIKEEQIRNLGLKAQLCTQIEELINAPYTSRKEWTDASEKLINIQKIWKTIGFAPKRDNTRIYERFRGICNEFFERKRAFYATLKAEMDNNYQTKLELCLHAEALRDSTDWKKATDELISLQKKWKEIGPVARRNSEVIWKRFRAACDSFFNNKSQHFNQLDSQYEENLARKQELLEQLRAYEITDRESGFEEIKTFQRRWSEIGFVPIKHKDKIQSEYRTLIDKHFSKLRGNEKDRKLERFKEKVTSLKGDNNDRSLRYERERLYTKIRQLETDIQLWENNIGFFAKSKNAEAMIRDVQNKIQKAKEDIATLTEKVSLIDHKIEN